MSSRWMYAACLAAMIALSGVDEGSASAAGVFTLSVGTLKVKGYRMSMVPQCGQGSCDASIVFSRGNSRSSQSHQYYSTAGRVTASSLRKAKVIGTFGSLGSMNMSFRANKIKKLKLPKGCKGKAGKVAIGRVTGSFKLVADSGYFRTVSAKSLPARVSSSSTFTCKTPKAQHGVYFGSTSLGALDPSFYASRAGSRTSINATAYEQRGGVRITHTLFANTTASHLVSDGATSAKLSGVGAISGTVSATFSGPAGSVAPLSGGLTGVFDSIGRVALTKAGGNAFVGKT